MPWKWLPGPTTSWLSCFETLEKANSGHTYRGEAPAMLKDEGNVAEVLCYLLVMAASAGTGGWVDSAPCSSSVTCLPTDDTTPPDSGVFSSSSTQPRLQGKPPVRLQSSESSPGRKICQWLEKPASPTKRPQVLSPWLLAKRPSYLNGFLSNTEKNGFHR